MENSEFETEMTDDIAGFASDPDKFVLYAYDWCEGELSGEGNDRPRAWQMKVLKTISKHLHSSQRYQPLKISVKSGHGIGKSALFGMVANWGLSTCTDCRIRVTANTETQLRTTTWPEISKWFRLSINSHWFDLQATAIISNDPKHKTSWRADAIPWSVQNTQAFAGLHNVQKRIIILFDEASGIDDKIFEVAEGALTDANTEIIMIVFGNPTKRKGAFYETFNRFSHRWKNFTVDAREVEGTNKQNLAEKVEDHGEDSDYVRVRIRGEFPNNDYSQLIPQEFIDRCIRHVVSEEDVKHEPLILGVDFARSGKCANVVYPRRGRKVYPPYKWHENDTMFTASRVVQIFDELGADYIFADGCGLGGPIIDRIKQLLGARKKACIAVDSASRAVLKPKEFFNVRSEIWGNLRDAIKSIIDLPDDEETKLDLENIEWFFTKDSRIQLVAKEDMAKSPDCGDALAYTFAHPVKKVPPGTSSKKRPPQRNKSWMA